MRRRKHYDVPEIRSKWTWDTTSHMVKNHVCLYHYQTSFWTGNFFIYVYHVWNDRSDRMFYVARMFGK